VPRFWKIDIQNLLEGSIVQISVTLERVSVRFAAALAKDEERKKARGVKLGRKPKLTLHQRREAICRRDIDGEPLADVARTCNVSRSTFSRLTV
jgi:DNA invertase Pin-like site-specific DNA recombinase